MNALVVVVALLSALIGLRLATLDPAHRLDPVAYRFIDSDRELPPLSVNRRLIDGARDLAKGEIRGPEHIVFDKDGWMYMGGHDGRILRTKPTATGLAPLETVVYTGNPALADRHRECGHPESEDVCGRPLGMAFDAQGKLIVADATLGLLSVDVQTKEKTLLVDTVDGQPLYFCDFVAVGPKSGKLYFTDATARWRHREFILDVMENQSTGRLLEYDPKTKKSRTLIDQMAFSNGILIDDDETYLLVVETNRAAILRYDLKAAAKLTEPIHWDARRDVDDDVLSVLIDNLPGMPDNLAWSTTDKTTFWTGCGAVRKAPFSLLDSIGAWPRVRKFLGELIPASWFFKLAPPYGLALRIRVVTAKNPLTNPKGYPMGQLVESLQDPTGSIHLVTGCYEHKDYMYIGSVSSKVDFVRRLPWTSKNETDTIGRF